MIKLKWPNNLALDIQPSLCVNKIIKQNKIIILDTVHQLKITRHIKSCVCVLQLVLKDKESYSIEPY
jgi:hypothetical protein